MVAGAAIAHDDNTIHACASDRRASLRLVEAPADCRSGETAVAWSITAPEGPQGPQVEQGWKDRSAPEDRQGQRVNPVWYSATTRWKLRRQQPLPFPIRSRGLGKKVEFEPGQFVVSCDPGDVAVAGYLIQHMEFIDVDGTGYDSLGYALTGPVLGP